MTEKQIKELKDQCDKLYEDVKTWTKEDKEDFVEWANNAISYFSRQLSVVGNSLYIIRKQYEAYLHAIDGKEYTFKE